MTIILYIDANVYINFFKWEYDRWRCLGEMALGVFNRILDGEFKLVISDHLLFELKKHVDEKVVDEYLQKFKDKNLIIKINKTREDINEAKQISSHYHDPLHAILARKAKAQYLITRDLLGYPPPCREFIEVLYPESLP